MLQFDAEASHRVEATYMTPDVVEQRQAVLGALGLGPGERVIDIGTGPGLLAAELAAAVGPDGLVCGIDISDSMLALARARTTRRLRGWLERAGLQVASPQVVPLCNVGFDPATYSAGLLDFVAGFVVGHEGLTAEQVQAWAADLRSLGTDAFFSLNRYLFCATKAA
jgi:SAM-dependent methyltransferase